MNKAKTKALGDFIGAGFKKVDNIKAVPPKIKWGKLYGKKTQGQKIEYLEKLASAMNHAAFKIQQERDALTELCEKKEMQIIQMETSLRQNNDMIQKEITRANEQRNSAATEVTRLNTRIRELEYGDYN